METQSSPDDYPPAYLKENIGPNLVAVSAVFIALDVVFVFLRYCSRRLINTPRGWDDILVYPALLFNVGTCSLALLSVHIAGVGRHLPTVLAADPVTLVTWGQVIIALVVLYSFAVAFSKLSILALYLRIFIEKRYRIVTWVLAAIVAATPFAVSLATVFQCSPVRYAWDKLTLRGTCIDVAKLYIYCGLPNVITDVAMLLLPIPMVVKLHTDQSQKFGISLVFFLGTIGLVSSCARLAVFAEDVALQDQTWHSVILITWADVESSVYLIAACLVSLRPLMRALAQQAIFKKHYWSNEIKSTSDEHVGLKRSARLRFSMANASQPLDGEHNDILKAERGGQSVQTSLSGGATLDEDLELAQLTTDSHIRVTNTIHVKCESEKVNMHGQDTGDSI